MWIRPLQANENSNYLTLMAPNQFVRDWVESNFYGRIKEIAHSASDDASLTVALEIGTGHGIAPAFAKSKGPGEAGPSAAAASTDQPALGNDSARANLNPVYTFDTFVEGKSNQFGRAASVHICDNPGIAYNPFFICGASGLGKTHLMQAVGHGILNRKKNARVVYLNSERYVAEMVTALQHNTMGEFKKRYRQVDASSFSQAKDRHKRNSSTLSIAYMKLTPKSSLPVTAIRKKLKG